MSVLHMSSDLFQFFFVFRNTHEIINKIFFNKLLEAENF